jgi:putative Ca2+/H+ antiporter (TMEM165/GDT1 family)
LAIGLGAFIALVGVAAMATVLGAVILRRVPLHLVHRVAGTLFGVFALLAAVAAVHG